MNTTVSFLRFPFDYQVKMRNCHAIAVFRVACVLAVLCCFIASGNSCRADLSPEAQAAVDRAVKLLRSSAEKCQSGYHGLVAYALLKGGVDPSDDTLAQLIAKITRKFKGGKYRPGTHHVYEAGVDLMALEALDAEQYRDQIQILATYLIEHQRDGGQWNYPSSKDGGDTSISQYAILGLWAAARAGIEVPPDVWNRSAKWHVKYQVGDGGFSYHPAAQNSGTITSSHSMTVAGVATLSVAKLFLYGDDENPIEQEKRKSEDIESEGPQYAMLERVDFESGEKNSRSGRAGDKSDEQLGLSEPRIPFGAMKKSILGGIQWLFARFTISKPTGWPMYYLYGLERMAALTNIDIMAGHDWYEEGLRYLVKSQKENGSWKSNSGDIAGACFGVLFITRATAKILNRPIRQREPLGAGLLAGGRGLPDDLSMANAENGRVTVKAVKAPMDELLAELANPDSLKIESVQKSIVETVQVGDREELIGKKDLLVKLVNDPRVEVRRTALWALGRCDDFSQAGLLIDALSDPDVDVMVEARNALCVLTRQPNGIAKPSALPESPLEGLPKDASEDERARRITKWRDEAIRRWRAWYERTRAYDEQDMLAPSRKK